MAYFIRSISTILLVAVCSTLLGSTSDTVQVLKKLLPTLGKKDTARVDVYNELAWQLRKKQPEEAIRYAEKGRSLAEKLQFDRGISDAHSRLGVLKKYEKDFRKALYHYDEVLKIRRKLEDYSGVAGTYFNIGAIYQLIPNTDSAIINYELGLKMLEIEEDYGTRMKIYYKLGNIYKERAAFPKAVEYFQKRLEIAQRMDATIFQANTYLSLGSLYRQQELYQNAITTFQQALLIFEDQNDVEGLTKVYHNLGNVYFEREDYDAATEAIMKSIELKNKIPHSDLAISYQTLGAIQESTGNMSKALDYYNRSLRISIEVPDSMGIVYAKINIGNVHLKKLEYQQALDYFLEVLPAVESQQDLLLLNTLLGNIAHAYDGQGDYSNANRYFKAQHRLRDTLESVYKKTIDLQLALRDARRREESAQQQQLILMEKNARKETYIQSIIAIFILISIAFFAFVRERKQRTEKVIALEKERSARLRIDDLLREQELESTYARLRGQKSEQKRIAQQLHDRVGSMLSTIKLYFKVFEKKTPLLEDTQRNQFAKATTLLDEACDEVRKISHNLASNGLKEHGLVYQIGQLLENIEESKLIETNFHHYGYDVENRFDLEFEMTLYHIVQELVANVLKHAKADKLTVHLNQIDDLVNILVEDNGKGFTNEESDRQSDGFGLKNIIKVVEANDGKFSIDTGKGAGTTITLDIPISQSESK